MATMTAFQLVEWGHPAEFREVEVPQPAAGEVLVKVAGVGLCHTDVHFLAPESNFGYPTPFTLGHETGGWVEDLGPGTTGFELGDPVVAVGIHSCGRCHFCVRGHDNYCPSGSIGRGYGLYGGLAQFVLVPARELIHRARADAIDAHDVGAEVGEDHSAERSRRQTGHLDDANSLQRAHAMSLLWMRMNLATRGAGQTQGQAASAVLRTARGHRCRGYSSRRCRRVEP